jgi:hypothetical protein
MCFANPFMHSPLLFCLTLSMVCASPALAEDIPQPQKVYLIGNSLTWDTLPGLLDGDVQWHVDCGKNLKYIFEHPEQPCVKTSKPWPQALKDEQFDVLSVQPHFGTNIEEDTEIIAHWLELQPNANLAQNPRCMPRCGLPRKSNRNSIVANDDNYALAA